MDKKIFNMFVWFDNGKYIQDDKGQILLDEKPELSFEYDSIRYYFTEQIYKTTSDGTDITLSDAQKQEIDDFIQSKREEVGILKLAVDETGEFLGLVRENDARAFKIVSAFPPTQDDWIWGFDENKWMIAYHYDENGSYVSGKSTDAVGFTKKPYPAVSPFQHVYDVTADAWVPVVDEDMSAKIKNKSLLDVITTFLLTLVSVQNSPTREKEILNHISTMLANDEYIIDIIKQNVNSSNLHNHFTTSITTINNNDALNSHVECVDFKSYCHKQIGKVLYNQSQETVADIVVEESLKANT